MLSYYSMPHSQSSEYLLGKKISSMGGFTDLQGRLFNFSKIYPYILFDDDKGREGAGEGGGSVYRFQ